MPGRNTEHDWSRMGYNGKTKDDEVYGKGNLNTAFFWEMDTRIERRLNLDPVDQIAISNYAVLGNNAVNNTDLLGDVVKGNKETGSAIDKALTANLGTNSPIKYNATTEELDFNKDADLSIYSDKQKDLIGRYAKLIVDPTITTATLVNRNQKVDELVSDANPQGNLAGLNANGATIPYSYDGGENDGKVSHQNVYIARDPVQWVSNTKVNFDGSKTGETFLEAVNSSFIGVIVHHELAGHAYLHLEKPNMPRTQHNKAVEDFHRSIQKFFKVGGLLPYKNKDVPEH